MPKEKKKKRITPVIEELVTSSEQEQSPPPSHVESEPIAPVEQPVPPVTTAEVPKESVKIGFGFFVVMIIVALFVALLTGGLYVYFNGVTGLSQPSPTPEPSATPTPEISFEASPTPAGSSKPTVAPKIADLKVSVLNGSGKIGEAGKVKAMLEKAGYKVTHTGNANTFDYTDTVIQAKASVTAEAMSKLKDTLKSAYSLKDGDILDSKNSFDIIVTVGAK